MILMHFCELFPFFDKMLLMVYALPKPRRNKSFKLALLKSTKCTQRRDGSFTILCFQYCNTYATVFHICQQKVTIFCILCWQPATLMLQQDTYSKQFLLQWAKLPLLQVRSFVLNLWWSCIHTTSFFLNF